MELKKSKERGTKGLEQSVWRREYETESVQHKLCREPGTESVEKRVQYKTESGTKSVEQRV